MCGDLLWDELAASADCVCGRPGFYVSSMTNPEETAFPRGEYGGGLTKREYFVSKAPHLGWDRYVRYCEDSVRNDKEPIAWESFLAKSAVQYADALIAALNQEPTK